MTKYEAIFRRKSIRRYREAEVEEKILEEIRGFGKDALGDRPDIAVRWKIYRASDRSVR